MRRERLFKKKQKNQDEEGRTHKQKELVMCTVVSTPAALLCSWCYLTFEKGNCTRKIGREWPLQIREMWLMACYLSVSVQAGARKGTTQPETSEFSRDINLINLCATKWCNMINPLQMLCAWYDCILWAHRLYFALFSVCMYTSFFIIFNFSLTAKSFFHHCSENQICPSTKLPILKSRRE